MNITLELTGDGSHTLVNTELDESYHVFKGALTESIYVYIDAGMAALGEYLLPKGQTRLRILEVGFGTGLNVLLTAQKARRLGLDVSLTTLEPFPVPAELVTSLNYCAQLAALGGYGSHDELASLFNALHLAPWDETSDVGGITLTKICGKLEHQQFAPGSFDLVYFDAFAPKKQPELWAAANFTSIFQWLSDQGLLVSYCSNGQFKRNLKAAGFRVESYPGPMGRRHMTRAWKGL